MKRIVRTEEEWQAHRAFIRGCVYAAACGALIAFIVAVNVMIH